MIGERIGNMLVTYRMSNKIIAYSMIFILVTSLFFESGKDMSIVKGQTIFDVEISGIKEYGVYKETSKEISYKFTGEYSSTHSYKYVVKKKDSAEQSMNLDNSEGTVTFNEGGTYEVTFIGYENETEKARKTIYFTLGKDPMVKITADPQSENGEVKVNYEASGKNFQAFCKVTKNDIEEEERKVNLESTEGNGYCLKAIDTFTEEGNYKVEFYLKDENQTIILSEPTYVSFVIDKTSPNLKIEGVSEGICYNEDKEISLIVEDALLGDPKTDYTVVIKKNDQVENLGDLQWEDIQPNQHKAVFSVLEEGNYNLKLTAKDKKGNEASKEINFSIDKTSPEIKEEDVKVLYSNSQKVPESVTENQRTTYYLNDDAKVTFKVMEEKYQESKVYVEARKDGSKINQPNFPSDMNKKEEEYSLSYKDEGSYEIKVWAEDRLQNKSLEVVRNFVIDRTKPILSFEGIEDNRISNSKQTLKVKVKDKNHNKNTYYLNVKRTLDDNTSEEQILVKDNWQNDNNDNETILQEVNFSEEGKYEIELVGKDLAGNEGDKKTLQFIIDQSAPEITQKSTIMNDEFYNDEVKLEFEIKEMNYSDVEATINIVRTLDGKENKETQNLSLDNAHKKFTYPFADEGKYKITINAKDKVGNEADTLELTFVIDKTKPEIQILGVDDKSQTKEPIELTYQIQDRNHEFSSYRIDVKKTNLDGEEKTWTEEWTSEEGTEGQKIVTSQKKVEYTEEGNYEIILSGKDQAENEADQKVFHFSIDHTAPSITNLTYSDGDNILNEKYGNIYSNHSVRVEFEVSDSVVGVDSNKIYVTKGREKDRTEKTPIYLAHQLIGNHYYVYIPTDLEVLEFNEPITIWANDSLGNEGSQESLKVVYNETCPVIMMGCDTDYEIWTSKDVIFHTKITDTKSGIKEIRYSIDGEEIKKVIFDNLMNAYEYDFNISKDSEKLSGYTIMIEAINNCGTKSVEKRQVFIDKTRPEVVLSGVQNGKHYDGNQMITVKVKDVSYKSTKTEIVMKRTLDGEIYEMQIPTLTMNRYEEIENFEIDKEGSYEIYAISTDGAGNKTKSNTLTFIIDKTSPKLNISGATNGSMNSNSVNLDFSCVESFYATNNVKIEIEKTMDGKKTKETIINFPIDQKHARLNRLFSEDGAYKIRFSAYDEAGNQASEETIAFSVDQTKPEIDILGSGNYQLWKQLVSLQFHVDESFYMNNKVNIRGTITDIDGKVSELSISEFASTGKNSILAQKFQQDGIYHLEIHAEDEAGNQSQKEINFTIDQTEPKIKKVASMGGKYYKEFQLADSQSEIFEDLTVVSYHILLNGIEYNGTDKITEEGKYNLYVDATDELNHKSVENIEFIIDHTAPRVIFTGVKNGEIVNNSGKVNLALENEEDEFLSIKMNGKEYGKNVRSLPYTEYGRYKIEVTCIDKAGNEMTEEFHFIYANPVVMPIIVVGIFLVGLAGCLCVGMYARKRRREEHR